MQPDPNISQQQSQCGKKIPQSWISYTGADLRLIDLAIRGFDSKTFSVSFFNPSERLMLYSPGGIKQGCSSRFLPVSFQVTTYYRKIKANFAIFGIFDGIFFPATFFYQSKNFYKKWSVENSWNTLRYTVIYMAL